MITPDLIEQAWQAAKPQGINDERTARERFDAAVTVLLEHTPKPVAYAAKIDLEEIASGNSSSEHHIYPKGYVGETQEVALYAEPSLSDYYTRCAAVIEQMREHIGAGYSEGDIEQIARVMIARSNRYLEQEQAPAPVTKLEGYCTECESRTTVTNGRCGCGSGRVIMTAPSASSRK